MTKTGSLIEKYGKNRLLNQLKWLSLQKNKRLIENYGTRKGDPSVIIKAISRVRQFSANIIGDNFEETRRYLEATNAFKDSDEYIFRF